MKKNKSNTYSYVDGKIVSNDNDNNISSRYVYQKDNVKEEFFKGTPFLYVKKENSYNVQSIEEYYVPYKKRKKDEYITFSDAIRNTKSSIREKIKVTKKSFKIWEKMYFDALKSNLKETETTITAVDKIKIEKVETRYIVFLIIISLFILILSFPSSIFWTDTLRGNFFIKIKNILTEEFLRFPVFQDLALISFFIIVITILFMGFVNGQRLKINSRLNYNYQSIEKDNKRGEKKQKRDFKKAKVYYLKQIKRSKKNYIKPLPIEKVSVYSSGIEKLKEYQQEVKDNVVKCKHLTSKINGIKSFLIIISTISWFGIIGFVLYVIINKLLF